MLLGQYGFKLAGFELTEVKREAVGNLADLKTALAKLEEATNLQLKQAETDRSQGDTQLTGQLATVMGQMQLVQSTLQAEIDSLKPGRQG